MQNLIRAGLGLAAVAACNSPAWAQTDIQVLQAFSDQPSWTIVINPNSVTYSKGDGDFPIFYSLAAATVEKRGGETIYRMRKADGTLIEMTTRPAQCTPDGEEQLPMTVALRDGDQSFKGCARMVDFYGEGGVVLGDLSIDSNIVNQGGPKDFSIELKGGGGITMLKVDGQDFFLQPAFDAKMTQWPWPAISANVARFDLVDETESIAVTAEIRAKSCQHAGKTYPMQMTVLVDGKRYESCASHAYMQPPPMMAIPTYVQ